MSDGVKGGGRRKRSGWSRGTEMTRGNETDFGLNTDLGETLNHYRLLLACTCIRNNVNCF